jgi:hypothetical protein
MLRADASVERNGRESKVTAMLSTCLTDDALSLYRRWIKCLMQESSTLRDH